VDVIKLCHMLCFAEGPLLCFWNYSQCSVTYYWGQQGTISKLHTRTWNFNRSKGIKTCTERFQTSFRHTRI